MMTQTSKIKIATLILAVASCIFLQGQEQQQGRVEKSDPDLPNLKYGEHERNILDLWKAKSDRPTPLVLFIHGGGFRQGDKRGLNAAQLLTYLEAGFSVASLNYRLTDSAPAPGAYLDGARALQFLRHHASEWNLDPRFVASTGGSAGAGISLWLALHDDLADPTSDDPIARESTRLTCVAVSNGQSSYDPRFAEKIGIPRPNFERHNFFLPFYGITADQIDTPQAYALYEQAAPISYLSADDPPAQLDYSYPNEKVDENSPLGLVVHHPLFGIALKEQMDALGIECVVQYRENGGDGFIRHLEGPVDKLITKVEFIKKQFETAQRALE